MSKIKLAQLSVPSQQKLVDIQAQEQKAVIAAGPLDLHLTTTTGLAIGLGIGLIVNPDLKWTYAATGALAGFVAGLITPW